MQSKPTQRTSRRLTAMLCIALALTPPRFASAEDIDLFVNAAGVAATNPNILIFLDNSANWNSNAQHWPTPAGETGVFKQGESELRAIKKVLGELDGNHPSVNLGLMMFRSGSPDGAIVRFAIRTMNTVNLSAFQELIGDRTCIDGPNSLNLTPNCIAKNFSGTGVEQTNTASTNYSGGLFDAYKYFGGWTSPAFANLTNAQQAAASTPVDSTHYGQARYFGGTSVAYMDPGAYTGTDKASYVSPVDSPCAKNYIIFIGNGFPTQDAGTLIQNVNTGASPVLPAQLAMQNFSTIPGSVTATLGTDTACESVAQCVAGAAAANGTDFDSYTCTGGTVVASTDTLAPDATCESAAACATRAQTSFPGTPAYNSWSCTGGTQFAGSTTVLGTRTVCETNATCVSVAQGTLGYNSYTCTGGAGSGAVAVGTDAVCESAAACATRAQASFPGTPAFSSWSCAGGTLSQTAPSTLQADSGTTCETPAACAIRAQTSFPGHTGTYSCTGGNTVTGASNSGPDAVCHSVAQCVVAAQAAFPGFQNYSCSGGTPSATFNGATDPVCESVSACATRAQTSFPGSPAFNSWSCTGGTPSTTAATTIGSSGGACETPTACGIRAATIAGFTGHNNYSCTGGTAAAVAPVTLVTDSGAVCETAAACATRLGAAFGTTYGTYTCTGGAPVAVATTTPNIGTDNVCHTNAACVTAAGTTFGNAYNSYTCTGGQGTGDTTTFVGTLANCNALAPTLLPGYNTYQCTPFGNPSGTGVTRTITGTITGCASGSRVNAQINGVTNACANLVHQALSGSDAACGAGSLHDQTMRYTDNCQANQTFQGTRTCGGGTVVNQTMNAVTPACSGGSLEHQTMQATEACQANQTMQGNRNCSGQNLVNQTMNGIINGCTGSNFVNQTMQGNRSCTQNMTIKGIKAVNAVTPLPTFSTPASNVVNYADEWANLLYTTDVTSLPGQQNVSTFTIDVFKDQQDANETALLLNMARLGGGKYFQATNEDAIVDALRKILIEIQSVNSVFASASLPINATNRSQNENQVFIGMFRPDGAGNPRWYGNLKRYQIAKFGQDFKLADASTPPLDAVSDQTGFIQACAVSFWTQDSGAYWGFQSGSAGHCTTSTLSLFSDSPDGPQVEKGAVAEVLRRGNNPPGTAGLQSPPAGVSRTLYTCVDPTNCCASPATCVGSTTAQKAVELVTFNATNVSKTQLGDAAMTDAARDNIINYTRGLDTFDVNQNVHLPLLPSPPGFDGVSDVRPTVHGDVAHSRPLPVNYGGTTGVVLYYGANDGTFRAVRGTDGKELWAFFAPEQHAKLKRLSDNAPTILYSGQANPPADAIAKDYFFDGSAGLFQNADNSKVWVFPTMRRGGRMVYAFDVTTPATPTLKWRLGCSNADLTDTASCTSGLTQMGQSWSIPSPVLIKGYDTNVNNPLVIFGGGYDSCDDQDLVPNTACASRKGNAVFVVNASTGQVVKTFITAGSVPSDVTLVDRDFDGFADHAYVSDTLGNFYRIDFVDPANPSTTRAATDWTIVRIGFTTGGNRKFLFAPSVLPSGGKLYVTNTSGDRERPLISNYPYASAKGGPVTNRAYMLVDDLSVTRDVTTGVVSGSPVNMDGASMVNFTTTDNGCAQASAESQGKRGWRFDLNNGTGEQGVTSSTIFGGLVFFSTNRPLPTAPGACANDLGEARGYAVNLLTASGAATTLALCGGNRSGIFVGGGLPPSPVTGVVPVGGVPVTVMIGGIQRTGGASSPIGSQRVRPIISQKRSRIYWYRDGDK